MDYLYLRPENFAKHSGKFGDFDHRDFVGKEFGSQIFSRTNKVGRRGKQSSEKGWLYALCPTPELWTEVLPHRTQIVQTSDQAVICFQLSLWDGKVVIEAGTGSGAMTTAMARCVMPRGSVRTFEFNEVRAQKARDEFEMNGLTEPLVVPRYRDVCGEGFGMSKEADAIFLDLPEPWLAVDHAIEACKHGARFCSYSPCIEQVQKTVFSRRPRLGVARRVDGVRKGRCRRVARRRRRTVFSERRSTNSENGTATILKRSKCASASSRS